jgi:hypothetical protein
VQDRVQDETVKSTHTRLATAINRLPHRDPPITLIMEWSRTEESKKVSALNKMTLSKLYHFAIKNPPQDSEWMEPRDRAGGIDFAAHIEKCMNAKRPKKALVSLLLHAYDTDASGFITHADFTNPTHQSADEEERESEDNAAEETKFGNTVQESKFANPVHEPEFGSSVHAD